MLTLAQLTLALRDQRDDMYRKCPEDSADPEGWKQAHYMFSIADRILERLVIVESPEQTH